MKKATIILFLIILLPSFLVSVSNSASKPAIEVGVVLPLSGDVAMYGEMLDRGIKLAHDLSNSPWDIRLHYEDSKGRPLDAVSGFKALRQRFGVKSALGFFSSSELLATSPVANKDKVVLISPTASAATITDAGPYIFRIAASDSYDARVLARFSFNDLKVKQMSVLYINNDYGLGVFKEFAKLFNGYGGTIVAAEGYAPGRTDFRTIILKFKSKSPQAMLIVGYKEMGLFLKQASELRFKPQFLSTGLFEDVQIIKIAGNAANNVYYSMPAYESGINKQVLEKFELAFRNKFSKAPDIGGKLGYDLYNCLLSGLALVKGNPNELRNGLLKIKRFEGVTGTFHFDDNGDVVRPYGIKQVKNGKFIWVINKLN